MPSLYKSWDPPRRVPRQVDDILRLRTPSSSEARRTREPSSKAVALDNQSVPDSGRIFLPCLNYQREIRLSVDLPMPRCRKCRLGCSRLDTQVGISRLLTKKTELGVRGCIPKSAFLAAPARGHRRRQLRPGYRREVRLLPRGLPSALPRPRSSFSLGG